MKNQWLDKRKVGGFPEDDANLNIFYNASFVQNESLTGPCTQSGLFEDRWVVTCWPCEYTPVLKGTMIGTVYMNGSSVQTFTENVNGHINFTETVAPIFVTNGVFNHNTGEMTLYCNGPAKNIEIVFSYEYNLEFQMDINYG